MSEYGCDDSDLSRRDRLGFDGAWSLEFVDGTLSEHDNEPEKLFGAAVVDLGVLREILG
ncbi:MAG: hypothetical protein OXN44_05315 [Acidimicrobiaceae bacterium]|nr:hypothetical protein [Acidimicrobiaceae bacterium]